MDEKNKQPTKQTIKQKDAPELNTGSTPDAKASSWKRLLAKKWVYPAVYIAAVAIILSFMWAYQGSDRNLLSENDMNLTVTTPDLTEVEGGESIDLDTLPVTVTPEAMNWPVEDFSQIEVIMPFYDSEASNEAQQAATMRYGDTFIPSVGISLSRQDNETFHVVAALAGKVTRVENHPIVGHLIEITHNDGLKTVYQSLSEIQVVQNDEVNQGDFIAKAGRNEIGRDLGVHMHFEVHVDGVPVNPETFIAES